MTWTVTTLAVAALATWELLEIWHHGSLFAKERARLEADPEAEFLLCPFCMAPWAAAAVLAALWAADAWWYAGWLRWPAYAFAAARLANLANDLTHGFCRTSRGPALPESEPPDGEHGAIGPDREWTGSAADAAVMTYEHRRARDADTPTGRDEFLYAKTIPDADAEAEDSKEAPPR